MQRPQFDSVQAYGRCFTDAAFWRPYVMEVCRRHRLECEAIRSGLPGTYPVFLVGARWVVKFFSDLFAGAQSFAVEREIYRLLEPIPDFPAPRLVAEGSLFDPQEGWPWPYLVSTFLPGTNLGEVYDQVPQADRESIADYLAHWLKRLHRLPLKASTMLPSDWEPFVNWLAAQRAACVANHRQWNRLPVRLQEQLEDYLPDVEALVDRATEPLLLHCDMNADHLLGSLQAGRWISHGLIDFGDARIGGLLNELVALHLGLFRCDKRLLRRFLRAYGSEVARQPDFARRAMSFTLLHEFNVLEFVFECFPALSQVDSLEALANRIWNLDAPAA